MAQDTSSLTIPNDLSYLPIAGAYVAAVAAQLGFDAGEVGGIRLALDEACSHVIDTAFEPGEEQEVTVSCQRVPGGLKVAIADKGLPFDPRKIAEYDAHGDVDRDLSGLPFYLMQRAMDEVRFLNKGWEGKELQLIKYLKVPSVETYFTPEELRPYNPGAELATLGRYEYRLMEQGDATDIARCVYRTYGYTYPAEYVYFPERVAAMNRSGEMISAVAVTESGEVIGHCALSGQAGAPLMEVSQAVVAPAHRGRGILRELVDLLMHQAHERRLAGLFIQTVTLHPVSQRVSLRYGFGESAVFLAYAPRQIRVSQFADRELAQRETIVYGFQSLHEEPASLVFPPTHHRWMIGRIYNNLGLARVFARPKEPTMETDASSPEDERPHFNLSSESVSALGIGVITVAEYGPGIEQEVKARLRDLCHEETAVVYLDLPLGDGETARLCGQFEELGFFFSGVLPGPAGEAGPEGSHSNDVLRLQYLNGPRIDYDLLQIYSDFGKELVQYVREQDPLA
jgi:serine/threonine-protein kinase RsbW